VQLSDRHGVRKFVLISSDKAVNPTSIMGVSKRVCEMLVQSRSQSSATKFIAVRFGNVLGSDGSVIPLFPAPARARRPITVTHPETRRYFMTIPEAVRLVLQAGAMGKGGEVFLLEMGEQVLILDLARQVIRLAGMREGEDIEIVFTGLRPGEKLYEELHSDAEMMRMTRNERILRWELDVVDEERLLRSVSELERYAKAGDSVAIREGLARLVPEFNDAPVVPIKPPVDSPATPLVQLPASTPMPAPAPERDWLQPWRRAATSAVAAIGSRFPRPFGFLLWMEARQRGEHSLLTYEVRIGRSRRRQQRRAVEVDATIDRRAGERRTRDLLGQPIRCARFRSDLGRMSRWVREHRLDKLPFLLNVLRGEMTLVGPMAEKEEFVLRWHSLVPEYTKRFSVMPGVTGLAQVSDCSDSDAESVVRRVHYDLFYVDNRTLLLDLRTMGRTLAVVARRRRPGEPGEGGASFTEPVVKGATQ
jgi:hypothetical protein